MLSWNHNQELQFPGMRVCYVYEKLQSGLIGSDSSSKLASKYLLIYWYETARNTAHSLSNMQS